MPIHGAPRVCLSQLPRRAQADLPGRCRSALVCVASLAFGGCQYVSGAANLEIGPSDAATAGAGGAGQAGSSGAQDGSTGGEPGTPDVGGSGGSGGSGGAGPWDCVGATPSDPGSADYQTSGMVTKLNTSTPVLNATVSACLSSDVNCTTPLATAVTPDGSFSMIVPLAFQGYFRVEPPAPFVPAFVQMTMPVSKMRGRPDIELFDKSGLDGLAGVLGTKIDEAAGHAFFSVGDCNGQPARNITVTVASPNAGTYAQFYLSDNSIPTTGRTYTGQPGGGGFVNLAPGLATFQVIKTDTDIRLAEVVAPIKAGVTTFFKVQPH